MARRLNNNCPRLPTSQVLAVRVDKLLHTSLAPATRVTYRNYLLRFDDFVKKYYPNHGWPLTCVSSNIVSIFIAYLSTLGYSPSTITSNVSIVSYIHKFASWPDPSMSFFS